MKEQAQAVTICRYLDQGAERLPYRVTERLAAARARAVSRLPETTAETTPMPADVGHQPAGRRAPGGHFPASLPSTPGAIKLAGHADPDEGIHIPTPHAPAAWRPVAPARDSKPPREGRSPLWWRLAATAVPLLVLAVGVVVVDTVHQEQSAAELAEVDSALLTDDVPLVAYADRGFGVYLKNTRR